jgi:hypothetical protein
VFSANEWQDRRNDSISKIRAFCVCNQTACVLEKRLSQLQTVMYIQDRTVICSFTFIKFPKYDHRYLL